MTFSGSKTYFYGEKPRYIGASLSNDGGQTYTDFNLQIVDNPDFMYKWYGDTFYDYNRNDSLWIRFRVWDGVPQYGGKATKYDTKWVSCPW
ncbi:hypothetical protein VIBNISOn1_650009 [Vibrio nigripulchritudo SOn1]|uniref:Uncharacterized protein n=1 Tax=Vibrio nigripulchritudo SOn1 TaxID=1238450 RepID=A0AAV2VVR6_9VIBR|nr:hypothetical protein VIBNISOn1_650009 [Vibrio nigripulchritudo SOn1]